MSRFDDALGGIKMPTTDDLQITLPPRREPKPAAEPAGAPTEGRDVGQHGGGAETPGDASSTAADSTPLPQRDEPDEGEHTDSTQEQMDQRALRTDTGTQEPAEPWDEAGHPEASDVMASEDIEMPSTECDEPVESTPTTLERALTPTEGKTPRGRVRAAFSPGAHTPTLTVKRFPQPLVDKLRILIAPKLGGEFAETISASALVSAFLVAQLGVDLDFDESTAAAVDAFRDEDQRVTVIEDRIELALQSIDQLAGATRLGLKRVSEVGVTTDSIDFAVAYLLTDRVAGLSTADVNESSVDVTQKKVLAARSRVRAAARAQRTIEQHDQMRSNR